MLDRQVIESIYNEEIWEKTKKLYGVPDNKTREDFLALCYEQDGAIYTPTNDECIAAGIYTKLPELLPKQPPFTIEQLQEENRLLRAQITAESDRSDFIEDCIAEMAAQVYV